VLMGTSNHDTTAPGYAPALIVATNLDESWAIYGLGGDDVMQGGNDNDILVGGIGIDAMDGKSGSDTYLVGLGDGFDNFSDTGVSGVDRIVATATGVQIGATQLSGIELISAAGFSGVNLVGSSGVHNTFNLTNVALRGIGEVSTQAGDDTIWTSNDSDAVGGQNYRGGTGHDMFHLGSESTNLLVSSVDNGGFDNFSGNISGDAIMHTLKAENTGTDIGLGTTFSNGVDLITSDGHANVRIVGSNGAHNNWDFSQTELVGIEEIATGAGDDTVVGSAGNDRFVGGIGADSLTGGAGGDTFVLDGIGGIDAILDYQNGGGTTDIIDLTGIFNVAGGTDLIGGGFIDIDTIGTNTLRIDLNGGGDNYTTIATLGYSGSPTAVVFQYLEDGHAQLANVAIS
jgi:hypothetical protein